MSFKYSQDELIKFKMESFEGLGYIKGVSSDDTPVLGATYIVKIKTMISDHEFPNEDYPFDTVAIPEVWIERYV